MRDVERGVSGDPSESKTSVPKTKKSPCLLGGTKPLNSRYSQFGCGWCCLNDPVFLVEKRYSYQGDFKKTAHVKPRFPKGEGLCMPGMADSPSLVETTSHVGLLSALHSRGRRAPKDLDSGSPSLCSSHCSTARPAGAAVLWQLIFRVPHLPG